MYKLLLSSRYLRTRFIALASIISVMLGVATMIVVNSVMAGFSGQMKDRLHGILADLMVESTSSDGFEDVQALIREINAIAGDRIEAITPAVEIYGVMSFDFDDAQLTQPVTLVGIVPRGKDLVSPMKEYLMSRQALKEDGEVIRAPLRGMDEELDWELTEAAAQHRVDWLEWQRMSLQLQESRARFRPEAPGSVATANAAAVADASGSDPAGLVDASNPFELSGDLVDVAGESPDQLFGPAPTTNVVSDPNAPLPARVYVGSGLVSYHFRQAETGKMKTMMLLKPGEDVKFTTVTTGTPEPARFAATVVDNLQEWYERIRFDPGVLQPGRTAIRAQDAAHASDQRG